MWWDLLKDICSVDAYPSPLLNPVVQYRVNFGQDFVEESNYNLLHEARVSMTRVKSLILIILIIISCSQHNSTLYTHPTTGRIPYNNNTIIIYVQYNWGPSASSPSLHGGQLMKMVAEKSISSLLLFIGHTF